MPLGFVLWLNQTLSGVKVPDELVANSRRFVAMSAFVGTMI